jgi:hypothetical protein
MAHIHCCAPLGMNAGVATTVPAFAGFQLGMTQGTYLSPIFSLADPSFYNPAFVNMFPGGLPEAAAALIMGIVNEQTYFNIHTLKCSVVVRFEASCLPSLFPVPSLVLACPA